MLGCSSAVIVAYKVCNQDFCQKLFFGGSQVPYKKKNTGKCRGRPSATNYLHKKAKSLRKKVRQDR